MPKLTQGAHLPRLLLSGLALTLLALTAFAHAKLVRSEPAANAHLQQAPKSIQLWFSEELEAQFNTIRVTDPNGKQVDKDDLSLSEGNKKLQIDLEELAPGVYTVEWKSLSTDQHTMKGKFNFTVLPTEAEVGTTPTQTPSQVKSSPPQENKSPTPLQLTQESGSTWSLSAVRWFEYLAMMTLFGGLVFHLLVLRPAVRRCRDIDEAHKALTTIASTRRIILLSWLSLVALIITALLSLVLQTSTVFEKSFAESLHPSLIWKVLTGTGFGTALGLELFAIIGLLVLLFLISQRFKRSRAGDHRALWWAALAAGALLLMSPAWTGHAAAAARQYRWAIPFDWLHMIGGAFWVGGLFHLTLTLPSSLSHLDKRGRIHMLHGVIPVFTRLAIASAVLIALTGVYNSWIHVDSFQKLWSTTYGKTLLLKVILMLPMLVLGGINTFLIHPRVSRAIQDEEADRSSLSAEMDRSFHRLVRAEAILGAAVLLVASILVFLTPAREHRMASRSEASTLTVLRK